MLPFTTILPTLGNKFTEIEEIIASLSQEEIKENPGIVGKGGIVSKISIYKSIYMELPEQIKGSPVKFRTYLHNLQLEISGLVAKSVINSPCLPKV